ncbi:MAG: hypothetical protein EOP08_09045, partial [Proteobacteria bacterium]
YARSEALKRSSRVEVCASADRADCSGSAAWGDGWIVFNDANGNGSAEADELLRVWEPPGGGVRITSNVPNAIYTGMGMAVLPAGVASASFLTTHDNCSGGNARNSTLSLSGTLQTQKTTDGCP